MSASSLIKPFAISATPTLTPAQRGKILPLDLDRPPPFVRIGDYRLGHEIGNLPTPGISHWILRHDWGVAAGIFNRGLKPFTDREDPQFIVALLQNDGTSINRSIALEERAPIRAALQSDLTDLFLDNAIALCSRLLKHAGFATAVLGMRFEHPGRPRQEDANFHIDPNEFRLFTVLEHRSLIMADERRAARAGLAFTAQNMVTGSNIYPADLIDAGVPVHNTAPGVPVVMRGVPLQALGPLSWHAAYQMPDDSAVVRPIFSADFVRKAPQL